MLYLAIIYCMPTEFLAEHSGNGPLFVLHNVVYKLDSIALILCIIIRENATKLIMKSLKGRESSEDEAWHKPCPRSIRLS